MSERSAHMYVQGSSALEMPSRFVSKPKVVRVDFGKERSSSAAFLDCKTGEHVGPSHVGPSARENDSCRFSRKDESLSFAQDLRAAYRALGVSQMYEELEQGSAAGNVGYRVSSRASWLFSLVLLSLSLFVLWV